MIILPRTQQSPGEFDNGRITERRPVLTTRRSGEQRWGPLFYWAWAQSDGGFIAEHPHQGFEIVSVVLEGSIEHRDSLGTWKSLDAGSVQVMQTNSGVSHSERFPEGIHSGMFQIWFEPNLRETLALPPTYTDYPSSAFSFANAGGNRVKHILGDGAPAPLRTDAHLHEIVLKPDGSLKLTKDHVHVVIVAIDAEGTLVSGEDSARITKGDAAFVTLDEGKSMRVTADKNGFRYAQVMVPTTVGYPLYPNILV